MKEVDAKGAVISLGDDIEGILKASEISRDRVEDARNVLKEGEEVEAKIISIDARAASSASPSSPRTSTTRRTQ